MEIIPYGLIAVVILAVVWWLLPIAIVKKFSFASDKERAETEDNYRKTLSQAIGAIAVIATFTWTFVKDRETIAQTRAQSQSQAKQFSEQQGQARNQFANQQFIAAATLIGQGSGPTRIAGLYAMEQIAEAQPADYLVPAISAAVGLIKTPDRSTEKTALRSIDADTQSAINIVARLNSKSDPHLKLSFRETYLVRGDFSCQKSCDAFAAANFEGAVLYGANFSGLDLTAAKFDGSHMADWEAYGGQWPDLGQEDYENTRHDYVVNFDRARLLNAGFDHVNMGGASFEMACLAGARFWATNLSRASFRNANLGTGPGCDLAGKKAHFYQATLIQADFDQVDVAKVNFAGTNLSGADFSNALNVDQADFGGACGDGATRFPAAQPIHLSGCGKQANALQ
ncbi:MAG: hypothetical protein JWQ94_858 [Tardiphaga sp.]|nr:hypothetical protein [Tardiphaga sp.]